MNKTTYTLSITPELDGLYVSYKCVVIENVYAGISGPLYTFTLAELGAIAIALVEFDLEFAGAIGPMCDNGFASAPLAKIGA